MATTISHKANAFVTFVHAFQLNITQLKDKPRRGFFFNWSFKIVICLTRSKIKLEVFKSILVFFFSILFNGL